MTLKQFEKEKEDKLKIALSGKLPNVKQVDLRQGEPTFFTVVLRNDAPFQTKPRIFTLE